MGDPSDAPETSEGPGFFDRLADLVEVPLRVFERIPARIQDRLIGLMLFVPGASVLATAAWLTPDPSGMGTHRQLGMGGCSVLVLTGFPCPMCGMTTTFTHFAHFEVVAGALNQPFGLVLFLATVLATAIGGLDLLTPNARWKKALAWIERHETAVALTLLVGMGGGWLYKIALVKGFLPWSP